MSVLVVKLGGSLLESGRIAALAAEIASAKRRIVVVPGGGPFADAVRAAQAEFKFSDAAAHDMAMLAMHQSARLLADMQPKFRPADSLEGFKSVWAASGVPVWLPSAMVLDDATVSQDWSMTSDGLSAWLAAKFGSATVLLVKSCTVPKGASAASLVAAGIVDRQFAHLVEAARLPWHVLGAGDDTRISELLNAV